jgi:hypothetical protein
LNSSAVASRKGTILATELHGKYRSGAYSSQQSPDAAVGERSNAIMAGQQGPPNLNFAIPSNESGEFTGSPRWQSLHGAAGETGVGRTIDGNVKRALRDEPNTDSSADSQSEIRELQSFSIRRFSLQTHRPSVQTNVTTPNRSSLGKPMATVPVLPTMKTLKHSTTGEATSLLGMNISATHTESRPTRRKSLSTMSPITVDSKAKPAVPELTWSLQRHERELSRLENEFKEIRDKPDEYRGYHTVDSKHIEEHTQTRQASSPSHAAFDAQVFQTYQTEIPEQDDLMPQTQSLRRVDKFREGHRLKMKVVNMPTSNEPSRPSTGLERYRLLDSSMLSDLAREEYPASPSPARQSDMHECIWRRLFLAEQRKEFEKEIERAKGDDTSAVVKTTEKGSSTGRTEVPSGGEKRDLGFKGLTLVVHRDDGEDLVLVCDL